MLFLKIVTALCAFTLLVRNGSALLRTNGQGESHDPYRRSQLLLTAGVVALAVSLFTAEPIRTPLAGLGFLMIGSAAWAIRRVRSHV